MPKLSRTKKTYKLIFSYRENKKTKEFSYTYANNKPLYEANDPDVVDQIYIVKKGNEILQVEPVILSIKTHMNASISVLNMQESPTSYQKWIRDFLEEEITIIVYTFKNLPITKEKNLDILSIIAGEIVLYHHSQKGKFPLYQREIPCCNDNTKDKKYVNEAKKIYNEIKEKGEKMTKKDLKNILKKLSESRPVFHSEADFQHSLAIEIKGKYPEAKIRLEVPFEENGDNRNATDLIVTINEKVIPIELKYKTKKLEKEIEGEKFNLITQGALNINSWAFFNDIKRIEDFGKKEKGFVIMITNDSSYYKDFKKGEKKCYYEDFKLHNNKSITKRKFNWGGGRCGDKYLGIEIKGDYPLSWEDYGNKDNGFKYLLLEITE
ncbi:MAG: hypothetical protein ACTSXL_01275 [Alphaproteobacteria bacterium]